MLLAFRHLALADARRATLFRPQFQPEDIKIDFFSLYLWLFNNTGSNSVFIALLLNS